jgi:hypothetical protein
MMRPFPLARPSRAFWLGGLTLAALGLVLTLHAAPADDPVKDAPKKPTGGKEVDGLQLTLSAETTKTVQKVDPNAGNPDKIPGGGAEPIKLTLTFTNVGQKKLKLNTFEADRRLITPEVADPEGKELKLTFYRSRVTGTIALITPKEADYPVLEPGKSWTLEKTFPGVWVNLPIANAQVYVLPKKGDYKIRFNYENKKDDAPVAAGAWTGKATSNDLTITVKAAEK